MKKTVVCLLLMLPILSASAVKWEKVQPGVWKAVIGSPEAYDLLKASGSTPYEAGFARLAEVEFPSLFTENVESRVVGHNTYLQFPLQKDEQLYGFGLNFQSVQQRKKVFELQADHYARIDNGRTHAPVPFYVSSKGYGVLINSARYLKVYAGTGVRHASPNAPIAQDRNTDKKWSSMPYSDAVEVLVPASGVEVYFFAGPTPMDAVRRYNLLCGGGALPPRWGLGFTQRTKTLYTSDQVLQEIDEFKQKGFPLDFIGLEPGWQSSAYPCSFEWDKKRFPSPATFVKAALDKGVRLNLWTNPYVAPSSSIYNEMKPFSGSHTVWNGIVPDLSTPEATRILKEKWEKEHLSIGVSGYKVDEVDGYDRWLWPDVAVFPSGMEAEQLRQTYGVQLQRLTQEMFRQRNQRTYGLMRASNAGASSYPYVLYSDNYDHKQFIVGLINSGFSGLLWTPEVRSSKGGEEWLRRVQTVVFSPMAMINAWSSGTKPWSYPEVTEIVKEFALLRMQMIPYWYSEFAKYRFEGTPPFYALNLLSEFSGDLQSGVERKNMDLESNPYLESVKKEIKDQYMAGESLLVAPLFKGEKERNVILPRGNWYDFYTGDYVGNGEVIKVSPGLERIPVYVKEGGIIPMISPRLQAPKAGEVVPLVVRHYGKSESSYRFYDDDGETFDYEKGAYSWRTLRVLKQKNGALKGEISAPVKGKPNSVGAVSWVFMTR